MIKTLTTLSALFVCALPVMAGPKPSKDAKAMQGTWVPVKWTLAGNATPPPDMSAMTLILKDNGYEFIEGPTHDIGSFSLKPDAKPREMDLVGNKGPNAGKTIPTIYKFQHGKLTVCYGLDGHRPAAFESPKKKLVLLVDFARKAVPAKK